MYHIFLIHSPFDGLLGCFHVSAIVNSAAVNVWVHAKLTLSGGKDLGFSEFGFSLRGMLDAPGETWNSQ